MNSIDNDLIERLHAVAQGFEMPTSSPADDVRRGRQRVRWHRGLLAGAAAATVAVMVGITVAVSGQNPASPDSLGPIEEPGIVVGDVPVWYDAQGLHRGDVVEQTPVEIAQITTGGPNDGDIRGALALVRSGAVYLDPATGEVWFHPWGGNPRIVGHNTIGGPGGDPSGDTAAWFEGSELVVYDTAAGREISRTSQSHPVVNCDSMCAEHYPSGSNFLQVSAERVAWNAGPGTNAYIHDVRTRETSVDNGVIDVHDDASLLAGDSGTGGNQNLVLSVPGQAEARFPELEHRARFSPSGRYALAVAENHDAATIDIRTGELWRVPRKIDYPWIAGWSYGDIALVDTEDALLACNAARRSCELLSAERPFLMPTN